MKLIDCTCADPHICYGLFNPRIPLPSVRHHYEVLVHHRITEPLAQRGKLEVKPHSLEEYIGFGKDLSTWL